MALIICPECNKEISDKAVTCPNCGHPMQTNQTESSAEAPEQRIEPGEIKNVGAPGTKWATGKLTISIISIVLFFIVTLQSCGAGVANTMSDNGESSGTFGFFVAFFMLIAGIVGITTRKANKKLGSIICIACYWMSFGIANTGAGSFTDLKVWGFMAFVFGVIHLLSISRSTKTIIISAACSVLTFLFFASFDTDEPTTDYEPVRTDSASVETEEGVSSKSTYWVDDDSEESDPDDNMIDFATERCHIKYTGHEVSTDYDGNPCLIFYYDFTNNSDVDTSADIATYIKAFQDGVQIESAFYSPDEENISYGNSSKQIQPGITINVAQVFELTSDSDVDVKASESFSLKDLEDSMTLSIK